MSYNKNRLLHKLVKRFVPNIRQVWVDARCEGQPFGGGFKMDIHITPAIIWTPWQKSCLASVKEL